MQDASHHGVEGLLERLRVVALEGHGRYGIWEEQTVLKKFQSTRLTEKYGLHAVSKTCWR